MKLETKLKNWDVVDSVDHCKQTNASKTSRKIKKQLFGKLKSKAKRMRDRFDAQAE